MNYKEDLIEVSKIFLITRLIMVLLILMFLFIPISEIYYNFSQSVQHFDAEHYLWIAKYGYTKYYLLAFFPLYPMSIKGLSTLGLPPIWAGILISNICCFFAGRLLYQFIPENRRKIGLYFWFLSPIAVYTSLIYTESLYIFLTLLTYFLYKRKKWFFMGLALGLSTATRNIGSLLFFGLFIEMVVMKIEVKSLAKVFIPASIIMSIYPIYNYLKVGSLIYFVTVQNECWGRRTVFPLVPIMRDIYYLFNTTVPIDIRSTFIRICITINIFSVFIAIYLTIKNIKKKENLALSIYMILAIILPLTSMATPYPKPATISIFRYMFGLFPIYLYGSVDDKIMNHFIGILTMTLIIAETLIITETYILNIFMG